MSKKQYKKMNRIIIGILGLIGLIIMSSIIIYNQNAKILDQNSDNPNIPKIHDKELSALIALQQEKGIKEILSIDCDKLSLQQSIDYCFSQQKLVNEIIGK